VEVHAVVESADSPVTRSRYLHRSHPRPEGPFTPDLFHRTLLQISDEIGRPAVLIAMDDISAIHIAALAPRLTGRYLLPEQPPDLPGRLADKEELAGLCKRLGIPHPAMVIPASAAEAAAAPWELGLPMVAKWSRPWLLTAGSGLRSTTLVHTAADAARLHEQGDAAGSRLLLQRYLPYRPDSDWFFHGYFGDQDGCLVGGTGRKVLSWPLRTGLTALGRWQPNPEVEQAALRLAAHVGYRGILDLDFRWDESSGAFHLLDFNPRLGAQFRLFTDRDGLDVVRAQYLDLTGRPVPRPRSRPGRVFVAENYALLSLLASGGRARPFRTAGPDSSRSAGCPPDGAGPASRRDGTESAWFAADDIAPFLSMAAVWFGRGLRKGRNRLRRPGVRTPRRRGRAVPVPRAVPDGGSASHPDSASMPR
jgi:predicted ATP-grasp superfamily ATP-dependent carboligase